MAQASGGRFLLRVEDIDTERCRPEFEQALSEDLHWLGLTWEEPPRRQSEHFSDYAAALDQLAARNLLYPCFCSRSEIISSVAPRPDWPRDPDGSPLYPGTCRLLTPAERESRLAAGRPAALRIDMAKALAAVGRTLTWREYGSSSAPRELDAQPAHWGDCVLARKDIAASYHIAVVLDDAIQGVTEVVRGEDLLMATSLHRLLQELLDLASPCYRHHGLVRDAQGQKLSKSLRAQSLRDLRREGISPAELRARLHMPQPCLAH